ncbi:MAG: LysE family translocator [Pseudohongiellaceae bacterium]
MTPENLIAFAIASTLLSLAPGPDNIFVLSQSALYGRRSGILITLGLCTGLLVHTSAVALGVAAIFAVSAIAFTAVKLVGAGYLLWLAWGAFRAAATPIASAQKAIVPDARALYRRGIIMNITNPKVAIFFVAFLPQFTNPQAGGMPAQLFLLGGIFILVALIVFTGIAAMAGFIADGLKGSVTAQTVLNRLAGLVFIALAIRLVSVTR